MRPLLVSGFLSAISEKLRCHVFGSAQRRRRMRAGYAGAGVRTVPASLMLLESRTLLSAGAFYSDVAEPFRDINLNIGDAGVTTFDIDEFDESFEIDLGSQSFNFGGDVYSSLYVSDNGLISFGSPNSSPNNIDLSTPQSGLNDCSVLGRFRIDLWYD